MALKNRAGVININTGDARKNLKELQEEVNRTSEVFKKAKASGDKNASSKAKEAHSEALKRLGAYLRSVREAAVASGDLNSLSYGDLIRAQADLERSLKHLNRSSEEFKEKMGQLQNVKKAISEVRKEMRDFEANTEHGTSAILALHKEGKSLKDLPLDALTKLESELTAEINRATLGSKEFVEANMRLGDVKAQIETVRGAMTALNAEQNKPSLTAQVGQGLQESLGNIVQIPTSIGDAVKLGAQKIKQFVSQGVQEYKVLEDKTQNLAALTGLAGDDLAYLESRAKELATQGTESAQEILDAFTLMGSAKPELLGNAEALSQTTEAALTLALASKQDAKTAVESLAATMNQFGAAASESERYINTLAAGSQAGSAAVSDISKSIVKFGATAANANISVEESVGLIETLAEKGIKGEIAGTQLNAVLVKLQVAANQNFNPAVVGMEKALDNLAAANLSTAEKVALFGRGNIVAGEVLVSNREKFKSLTKAVTGTSTAYEQAALNGDTLALKQKSAENAIQNMRMEIGAKLRPLLVAFYEKLKEFWKWAPKILEALKPVGNIVAKLWGAIVKYLSVLKDAFVKVSDYLGYLLKPIKFILSLVGELFTFLTDGLDNLAHSFGRVKNAAADYNKELAKEQALLAQVVSAAKDAAEGSEERKRAIEKLNQQYGKYLPQLLTEKSSLEEIENAQKLANEALKYNLALKSQQEKLADAQSRALEEELQYRTEINELLKEQVGGNYDLARAELEQILAADNAEQKLDAFRKKWNIDDTGFFSGSQLQKLAKKLKQVKEDAIQDAQTIRDAFSGILTNEKPKEYNHNPDSSTQKGKQNSLAGNVNVQIPEDYIDDITGDFIDEAPGTASSGKSASRAIQKQKDQITEYYNWLKAELKDFLIEREITQEEYDQQLREYELAYYIEKQAEAIARGEDDMQWRTKIQDWQIQEIKRTEDEQKRLQDEQAAREEKLRKEKEQALKTAAENERKILAQKEKEQKERDARELASYKKKFDFMQNLGQQFGQQIAQYITDAEFTQKQFGKKLATIALDSLQTVVRQSIASIWAQSLASADSIASYGVAGAVRAAALTALVEAAFATAKGFIARQHYEGTLHYQTGTKYAVEGAQDGKKYYVPYIGSVNGVRYVAHPALISEQGGEIIVDAARSQQIRMRYPWLLEQLKAVPQYADGSPELTTQQTTIQNTPHTEQPSPRTVQTLVELAQTLNKLNAQLSEPLRAYLSRDELFHTLDRRSEINN